MDGVLEATVKRYALADKRVVPVTRTMLHASAIPERYWTASLQKLEDSLHKKKLVRYLVTIADQVSKGQGLFIYGVAGTGKTSAGVAVMKEVIRRGGSTFFVSARHLLRAMYDNEETPDGLDLIRHRMRQVDLLMFDALGTEGFNAKGKGGAELEGLFCDRYDVHKPVLITSKYAPTKLKNVYPEAIVSIVRRTVAVVRIQTKQWKKEGT